MTLRNAEGEAEALGVTGYHKFYDQAQGWQSVVDLTIGDSLRGQAGQSLTVVDITRDPGVRRVYNLTVESDHVYFVGDLTTLTHNNCPRRISLPLAPESQGVHKLTARFENVSARRWASFPAGVPRPTGPINLIKGAAYDAARQAADQMNSVLRQHGKQFYGNPLRGNEIHEIVPVKFGGSPTALTNKVALQKGLHRESVNPWFNSLQRILEEGT